MRKLLPILVLTTFIIPSVVFAAWWNPLTWFGSNSIEDQKLVTREIPLEGQVVKDAQQSSTTQSLLPLVDIPSTTNALSLQTDASQANDESQLKAKISSLTAQNNLLALKLEAMQNQLAALQKDYTTYKANLVTSQSSTTNTQNSVQQISPPPQQQSMSEDSKITAINIHDVTCSWGGSDNVYILPFSVDGSWTEGYITIRSNDGTVRMGGLVYKSDVARDSGYRMGIQSTLNKAQNYTYTIDLYSEVPSYNRYGAPNFPSSSLIIEKTGTFSLPGC